MSNTNNNNNNSNNTNDIRDVDQAPAPEQIASIAFTIAMFEATQKLNVMIARNKICGKTHEEIYHELNNTRAFYDAGLITQMINGYRQQEQIHKEVGTVTEKQVEYVLKQLQQTKDIKPI